MTEEHTYLDNRITCEKLPSGAWQYSIDDRIQGEKFYPSADDAYSDAVDLLIVLGWRGPMTGESPRIPDLRPRCDYSGRIGRRVQCPINRTGLLHLEVTPGPVTVCPVLT
jgi:hypothetical protein